MRGDWCVSSWFRIKNTHSLTVRYPSRTDIAAPLYPELSFSPEARRGPTRQPLLAFSSQDLRPGPWPARHRRFRALGSTGLLCGRLLVALVESVLAARRVGESVSSDVSLCTSHRS